MRRTAGVAVAVVAIVVAVATLAWGVGLVEYPGEDVHDQAVVTVSDANGTRLAIVDARVADTRKERIRGLSGTASLENGSGMLFVHPRVGNHSYVMRDMAFPLDIVFVAPCGDCPSGVDGRVTVVHGADVPPTNEQSPTYEGRGKWVLEVPQGYAAAHGIGPGDYVHIHFGSESADDRNPYHRPVTTPRHG